MFQQNFNRILENCETRQVPLHIAFSHTFFWKLHQNIMATEKKKCAQMKVDDELKTGVDSLLNAELKMEIVKVPEIMLRGKVN